MVIDKFNEIPNDDQIIYKYLWEYLVCPTVGNSNLWSDKVSMDTS